MSCNHTRAAAQADRDAHLGRARKLEPKIRAAASSFDAKLAEALGALGVYARLCSEQESEIGLAGETPRRAGHWAPQAAMLYAMNHAGLPRGILQVEGTRARPCLLAEAHPDQGLGD